MAKNTNFSLNWFEHKGTIIEIMNFNQFLFLLRKHLFFLWE